MLKKIFLTSLIAICPLSSAYAEEEVVVGGVNRSSEERNPYAVIEPSHDITGFMNVNKDNGEEEKDIHFSADEMENNQSLSTITAKGNVEIIREGMTLKADKVIYNQKEDIITAVGNVVLLEESGNVVFSDYVVLTDRMKQGQMENIKIIMLDKTRVAARSVKRLDNDDKIMKNVVYSPCDVCKNENPLWQIKARKVTHDAENKNVNYKDATLEVKGAPVFYTPFLSHPDPTVKRRSGFLAPTIKSNSYLGAAIQPRYFWDISEHEDMTLTPIFTTDKGPVLSGNYRKYFYSGEFNFEGSMLRDDDIDKTRGHVFAKGRYEVNDFWVASTDINYASNGAYLKDLSLGKKDNTWLTSNAMMQGFDDRNFASIETYYYKLVSYNFRPGENKPYVVPVMSYENISDPNPYGAYFKNTFDFASIYRKDEETSDQRFTMINSWVLPYTSPYGEKYRLQASVKSDGYYVDNYTYEEDEFSGATGRIFPQMGLEWKLPFVRATETSRQILEPTIVAVAAPNGGNKYEKIPNEDSRYQQLEDTNILNIDRQTGYDRNDTGSRVSYGLNWSAYGEKTGRTSAFFAQSYEFKTDSDNFPDNKVHDSRFSDYVGRLYAAPHEYLNMDYRFRMDKDNYDLNYSELSANMGPKILNATVAYIFLQKDAMSLAQGYAERKELYTGISSALTKDWSIRIYNLQDLTDQGGTLEYGGSLTYEDECLKLITDLRRNNSSDPDFKGDFELSVTFLLKTLGGFGSK